MSADQAPLSGLVLAGGRSRRMGTDKAHLRLGGQTLLEHALQVVGDVACDVLVAGGNRRALRLPPQVRPVRDVAEDAGPLAGLVAGLEAATHPLVAVIAVDLPFANAAVLRLLEELWRGEPAVVPVVEGRPQPLHAVWAAATAPALRARLVQGDRSLAAAARALGAGMTEQWRAVDPTGRFARNINSPGDYFRLR